MAEPIQVDSHEVGHDPPATVANLTPVLAQQGSLVKPSAPIAEVEQAFRDYTELCNRLLNQDDYQQIGNKSFRKKSAWRKLATAFGVSAEMLWKEYEREGRHIVRAEVMMRATAPNGRFMDGLGACDAFERCCADPCPKTKWNNHTCCTADCNGFVHFSKPNHDIPATAMTRATNRACADLFGMGEVSAEEVTDHGEAPAQGQPAVVPAKAPGWADADAESAAHKAVSAQIKKLKELVPEDHPALVDLKEHVAKYGWPMVPDALTALSTMVAKAHGAATASAASEAPSAAPGSEAQAEPVSPAPAPETASPGSSDEVALCPWCENAVETDEPSEVHVGEDGQPRAWHTGCRAEWSAEDDPGRAFE